RGGRRRVAAVATAATAATAGGIGDKFMTASGAAASHECFSPRDRFPRAALPPASERHAFLSSPANRTP
ncbi:hypothetical protein, partial [Halorubrum sp. Ea1]|uniref:hypothetical protein n=1 Tax=Halorubrum sp. Ea1 TaxID=1480718 RepID=UPI001C3D67AE